MHTLQKDLNILQWVSNKTLANFCLHSKKPIRNAHCMIVLPNNPHDERMSKNEINPQSIQSTQNISILQISDMLTGMISVLALKEKNCGIFWLNENTPEINIPSNETNNSLLEPFFEKLIQAIHFFAPYTLLFMGFSEDFENTIAHLKKRLNAISITTPIHKTHHPCDIIKNPNLKPKAYQDLLNLKKEIESLICL